MAYPSWTLGSDTHATASDSGKLALSQSSVRGQKRALDLGIALLALCGVALLLWTKRGRRMLSHVPPVLWGRMTWVGYLVPGPHLPPLRPSVFQHGPGTFTVDIAHDADLRYAENWRPELDLIALFGGSF